ncbi:MAG TPA: nuclear transport factor 2 family protein [Steroidobacteraceae bacterium]|nr:nuclear transport factor 2 family protein [Steroidobacteraceae bacterium]
MNLLKACILAALAGTVIGSAAWVLPRSSHASTADANQTLSDLRAQVARLQRRIVRIQDADQIENLISAYGYYLDKREWDELADLFADDATMEISLRGIYVGKQSIRRALELFGPLHIATGFLHNHIQLQPVIHVSEDGTRAWSRSRALSEIGTYQRTGIWGDGVYVNEYVKQNGIWKIAKDHIYTGFFATYDKGWESGAGPAPKASEKIPPDRPPSVLYDTYPGEYVPPFDYKNPVTGADIEIPPNLQVRPNGGAHP